MRPRALAASALLSSSAGGAGAGGAGGSLRPIIGVLTLPNDLPPSQASLASYFPASYASWLESGGAAAFFAGDGSLTPYAATAALLVAEARAAAAAGEVWPLWGTCLGHELALVLAAGPNRSVLSAGFDAEDLPLALAPAPGGAAQRSRLWGSAPPDVWRAMTDAALNVTMNLHTQGVTPADFAGSALAGSWDALTTNVDRAGREFVSSAEARDAAIYTTQFHPEKPAYEYYPGYAIPHSDAAIHANGWCARFFVNESRRNARAFATVAEENAALVYNYAPIFTAADPDPKLQVWEQIYGFWGGF